MKKENEMDVYVFVECFVYVYGQMREKSVYDRNDVL